MPSKICEDPPDFSSRTVPFWISFSTLICVTFGDSEESISSLAPNPSLSLQQLSLQIFHTLVVRNELGPIITGFKVCLQWMDTNSQSPPKSRKIKRKQKENLFKLISH